jgi:hypothetical protein
MAGVSLGEDREKMSGRHGAHFGETLGSAPTVRCVGE